MNLESLIKTFCVVYPLICNPPAYEAKPYEAYLSILNEAKNPSREAAQTQQESAWNPKARSPYAKGLRQFTDKTGWWASRTFCADLGAYRPYNPTWSLKCGIRYMEKLERQVTRIYPKAQPCWVRKVAEQMYNGGGWILKELKRSKSTDLNEARRVCSRASWACKENYEYPKRISKIQNKDFSHLRGIKCF